MDDLATRMDAGFERVDNDIRELRRELRGESEAGRAATEATRGELRAEIRATRGELKSDIAALQALTMRFGLGLLVGMVGMIATLMGAIATGTLGA